MIKTENEKFVLNGTGLELLTELGLIVCWTKAILKQEHGERFAVQWIMEAVAAGLNEDLPGLEEAAKRR